jgi:hypothetical protein
MAERTPRAAAFAGPPRRLALGTAALGPLAAVELPAALQAHGDPHHPVLRRGADPLRARLRLRPSAPPGQYTVTAVKADGTRTPVLVTVQSRPRLRVRPGGLRLAGAPGTTVRAELLLENRGNVPLDIATTAVNGVFADNGFETAMAAAYRLETDDPDTVLKTIFGRLRESHGGLLKVRVVQGAGALAVGETRAVVLEVALGAHLRPGRSYHGTLPLGGHTLAVRLAINGANKA